MRIQRVLRGGSSTVVAALLWLLMTAPGWCEVVNIQDIISNLATYQNEKVTVEGFVAQKTEEGTESTQFYYIRDDYGWEIKVRSTTGYPEVGKRYRVQGVVDVSYSEAGEAEPFISETSKAILGEAKPPVTQTFSPLMIAIIALTAVAVILLIVLLALRRSAKHDVMIEPLSGAESFPSSSPLPGGMSTSGEFIETSTIKIQVPQAGTVKMYPGYLEVAEGADGGQMKIRFFSREVTFGRSTGEPYKHIQLKLPSVSRKQARLLISNERFMLINESETNMTQVNGKPLEPNGTVELNDGDEIRMGEVLFKFHTGQ